MHEDATSSEHRTACFGIRMRYESARERSRVGCKAMPMTRSSGDDYERYLTRRRRSPEPRGATLSERDFEHLLRKLDRLCILDLERALSSDERAHLAELQEKLEIDVRELPRDISEDEDATTSIDADVLEDLDETDLEIEDVLEAVTKDENPLGVDPHGRLSRLGSPRPDARNRRSIWQQRRRGSRPC